MVELLSSRVQMYRLLRDLFTYPVTEGLLNQVLTLQLDPEASSALQASLALLQKVAGAQGRPHLVEVLNKECSRLMSGPGLPPAPPFASYYRDQSHSLFTAETQAVARVYQEAGLVVADQGTPSDHITFELEFMMAEALQLQTAANEGEEARFHDHLNRQQRFLCEHLLPFASEFAARLRQSEPHEFCDGAADLLAEYLTLDSELLHELSISASR